MRLRFFWSSALVAAALHGAPAGAQDALGRAFRDCADASVAAAERIENCNRIVDAQGLETDETAFAYVDLGMVYAGEGKDDSALAAFDKALALQPSMWQALADRAGIYLQRGDIDPALADYKAATAIDPSKVAMFRPNVGSYRTERNGNLSDFDSQERERSMHDSFLAELRDALARALSGRCRMRATSGHAFDSAIADCNAALEISPGYSVAIESRGLVEFEQGDFRAAVADFGAMPANAPELLYLRGAAKHRLGQKTEGDADIAAAEKLKPGIAAAMATRGIPQ